MTKSNIDTNANEREFYNDWAEKVDVSKIKVEKFFESSTCPENRYLMTGMDKIKDSLILDLGCGAGENSVYFTLKGANCIATDYSDGMLHVVDELAARYNVKVKTQVVDAMNIPYPDNTFDYVYIANTLHHVDFDKCTNEIYRVLKPGGKMLSWNPSKHNPIINIYRRMATKVRTEDESPLNINVVDKLKKNFSSVQYDTFWFATLWIFIRFYLIEKVHPNDVPYWKKNIYDEERIRSRYLRLEKFDRFFKKIPFMKRFAWNIAIIATK